jgi:hypothetical protein
LSLRKRGCTASISLTSVMMRMARHATEDQDVEDP